MIDPLQVMARFVPELIAQACSGNKTAVLMLDQSKICDGYECLMISLRLGERAILLAWCVEKTRGNIGFKGQKPLLEAVLAMMSPEFD